MYYRHETEHTASITIRPARPEDGEALRRLAERDSTELPAGDFLVASVGGELRAAVQPASGEVIADPFHRTAELTRLLTARAAQLRDSASARPGLLSRLLGARPQRSPLSPQPAGTLRTLD